MIINDLKKKGSDWERAAQLRNRSVVAARRSQGAGAHQRDMKLDKHHKGLWADCPQAASDLVALTLFPDCLSSCLPPPPPPPPVSLVQVSTPPLCARHPAPCQALVQPGKWGSNLGVKSPFGHPWAHCVGARLSKLRGSPQSSRSSPLGREVSWEPRG